MKVSNLVLRVIQFYYLWYNDAHTWLAAFHTRIYTYNPSSTWIHYPFHTLMREARRKLAVSRRQKITLEHRSRGIKRGTLHCGDDVKRSKEKTHIEGVGREIWLSVLLCASKTEMHVSSSIERGEVQKLIRKENLDFKQCEQNISAD